MNKHPDIFPLIYFLLWVTFLFVFFRLLNWWNYDRKEKTSIRFLTKEERWALEEKLEKEKKQN